MCVTFEVKGGRKKTYTKAKGFGHHKLQSSAIPPSNSLLPPCYHDYPYHTVPHTSVPLCHPPTPKVFSCFLLFPFVLNRPPCHLCLSVCLTKISLSSVPYFWFSTNPLILDLGKKRGNCSPAQQPLCTLLYRCQMHYGTYLLVC